jgi:hypothetical protein
MKKSLFVFAFIALMAVITVGCTLDISGQSNTPGSTPAAGTPAPSGQVNLPGVSIQVYAPGPNPLVNTADAHGQPAGFWTGLWHGIISPVTLLVSFINKQDVRMYEVHNDGNRYNFGFFLGILVMPAVFGLLIGSRR